MLTDPQYHRGDRIGGRYQVHQALSGGMGEVYLCRDLEKNYPLALKTFQRRFLTNMTIRDLFKQEVATWVALEKHPHVVQCIYMDMLDNRPFMFLEWVAGDEQHGTDLRGWLRHNPLDLRPALQFSLDICSGLTHAQEKVPGIVHRDLKPENILVAQGEVAKITDFGLAQIAMQMSPGLSESEVACGELTSRQSLMRVGGVAGTPPYMAPVCGGWLGGIAQAASLFSGADVTGLRSWDIK
jgi:serine/threonine protein kinase